MKEESDMPSSEADQAQFVKESALYKEFLAERAEILKHKWSESEDERRRAPKRPPPNFCTFKAILRGRQGNRETKTEFNRQRPDHGRGSNSSGATPDCARDHRGKPAPRNRSARGDSVAGR